MLSQAERLIADRVHNRLTWPSARSSSSSLRACDHPADAYDEAEVRAAEEQRPRPQPPPIAQERLKEMALALASPEAARRRARPRQLAEEDEPGLRGRRRAWRAVARRRRASRPWRRAAAAGRS